MWFTLDIMQIKNDVSLNFKAGLSSKMRNEISSCNVKAVSSELLKNGIQTDFKDNKLIAWCILKTYQIAKNLRFGFPNAIVVEDFNKLHNLNDDYLGFCNIAPTRLYKDNKNITSEKSLFFNQNINWEKIDEISDETFDMGLSPSNFFLNVFLHEFAHSMHEQNLLNKIGGVTLIQKINKSLEEMHQLEFHKNFADILSVICPYAATSSYEAVACDLSNRIIKNLNKNTLEVDTTFVNNSPYRVQKWWNIHLCENTLSKALRQFWNGKFL